MQPDTVRVTVRRDFTFQGVAVRRGQQIEVTIHEALILSQEGRITLSRSSRSLLVERPAPAPSTRRGPERGPSGRFRRAEIDVPERAELVPE